MIPNDASIQCFPYCRRLSVKVSMEDNSASFHQVRHLTVWNVPRAFICQTYFVIVVTDAWEEMSFVPVVLEVTWRVVEARAWFGGWPYVSLERQTALPFLQHFDRQVGVQLLSSQTKWWAQHLALKFFPRAELLPSWASGLSGKSCRSGWFHTAADSC